MHVTNRGRGKDLVEFGMDGLACIMQESAPQLSLSLFVSVMSAVFLLCDRM